jgi:hypothetical protein
MKGFSHTRLIPCFLIDEIAFMRFCAEDAKFNFFVIIFQFLSLSEQMILLVEKEIQLNIYKLGCTADSMILFFFIMKFLF